MEDDGHPKEKSGMDRMRESIQGASTDLHADDEETVRMAREEAARPDFVVRAREIGGQVYGFVSDKSRELYNKLPKETKAKIGSFFEGAKADVLEHVELLGGKAVQSISEMISGDPYKNFEEINRRIKQCGGEITDVGLARERLKETHGGSIDPEIESKFVDLETGHRKTLEDLKKKREVVEVHLGAYDAQKGNLDRSRPEIIGEIIERFDDKLGPHNEQLEPLIKQSGELKNLIDEARKKRAEFVARCVQEARSLQNASSSVDRIGPEHYLVKAKKELAGVDKKLTEYSGDSDKINKRILHLREQSSPWSIKCDALAKTLKSSKETHGLSDEIDLEVSMTSGTQMVKMIRRLDYLSKKETTDEGTKEVLEGKKREIAERILGEIKSIKGGDKLLEQLKSEDVETIEQYGPTPVEELTLQERNANNHAIKRRSVIVAALEKKYSIRQDDAIDLYEALAKYNKPVEAVQKEGADEKTRILEERERMILEQMTELQKALDEIRAERRGSSPPEAPEGIAIQEEEKKTTPGQYAKAWNTFATGEYKIGERKFVDRWSDGASEWPIDELEQAVRSYFHGRSRKFTEGLDGVIGDVRKSL